MQIRSGFRAFKLRRTLEGQSFSFVGEPRASVRAALYFAGPQA